MWCSARFNFRSSTVFIYVNDISQAVEWDLYLCANDSSLLFQHKKFIKIKKQLIKDFNNMCDWLVKF